MLSIKFRVNQKFFRENLTLSYRRYSLSSESSITPKQGKYLTFMYRKQVEEGKKATTTILSRWFRVNPATTTEILQKLAEKNLVKYARYYGAKLTEKGVAEAQKLLRKHRVLEVMFVNFLKYDTQKACQEASKIDHYCSEDLINSICRTYKHPNRCPCDKTIFDNIKCRRQDQTEKSASNQIGDLDG